MCDESEAQKSLAFSYEIGLSVSMKYHMSRMGQRLLSHDL